MDVLDPREVEGHGNKVPGGPSSEELARLFEQIFRRYEKASAIEFATIPSRDEGGLSIAAVNRMIEAAVRGVAARSEASERRAGVHMRFVPLAIGAALAAWAPSADMAAPQPPTSIEDRLPGEAMYPLASRDTWAVVLALIRELGFRTEKNDGKHQVLVTQWRTYDTRILPDVAALGLPAGDRPLRVQFHMMVARDLEPARVAVGSILEIERAVDGRRTTVLGYRPPALDGWFLMSLDQRAGVNHTPMPAAWQARRKQAAALMPAGLADPCLTETQRDPASKASPPVKLSDVRPIFPSQGFDSGESKVVLVGALTEHGTLTDLKILNPSDKYAHYESSARAATSLWRFQPTIVNNCPVPGGFTASVNYRLR